MNNILRFPDGFRWGAATAAHQNEGANHANNWSLWEQQPGRIAGGQVCGLATNWWDLETAAADFDRAAGLGLNSLRISVEWSRIEPSPGEFDARALAKYAEMVSMVRERGLEPMVTLHHFTDPAWLGELGGWENPLIGDYFSRFTTGSSTRWATRSTCGARSTSRRSTHSSAFTKDSFPRVAEAGAAQQPSCAACFWPTAARIGSSTGCRATPR